MWQRSHFCRSLARASGDAWPRFDGVLSALHCRVKQRLFDLGFTNPYDYLIEVEHVIEFYHKGFSPEAIIQELPSLSLEKIHATITYYLHNKVEVDQYMARRRAEATRLSQEHDQQEPSPALQRLRKRRGA